MEHKDAIRENAVYRYLLGQMTEEQRGIFEEHYFECSVCTEDLTDGTRMMIVGKSVAAEDPQTWIVVPARVNWFQWFPAAAAASLAIALLGGWIGSIVRPPHESELVQVANLDTGISRSGTPAEIPVVRPGDGLRFDVPPSDDAVEYGLVVTCGGKTESTHRISRVMAAGAVTLRIGELPAGRCELVIEGVRKDGKRFPITSSPSPFKVGER